MCCWASPAGYRPYFSVSNLRLTEPVGPRSLIYFPQEQVSPVIPPGIGLQLQLQLQLQLIYDRQSVGQSVLVSGAHLGPVTNFSFSLKLLLDSCGFVIGPAYNASNRTHHKTPPPNRPSIIASGGPRRKRYVPEWCVASACCLITS
jgi:hypothetical protein